VSLQGRADQAGNHVAIEPVGEYEQLLGGAGTANSPKKFLVEEQHPYPCVEQ
jgi:hypothetical protein